MLTYTMFFHCCGLGTKILIWKSLGWTYLTEVRHPLATQDVLMQCLSLWLLTASFPPVFHEEYSQDTSHQGQSDVPRTKPQLQGKQSGLTCSICLYHIISTSSSWCNISELLAAAVTSSKVCSLEKSILSTFFNITVPSMLILAPKRRKKNPTHYKQENDTL